VREGEEAPKWSPPRTRRGLPHRAGLMDDLDFEINVFAGIIRGRLAKEPGYTAVQNIPGIGPTLGAALVAEIGDVSRFASASKLTCWAGLTPKHHESDTHVRRGRITKQGSRLVRWAAIESVKTVPKTSEVGVLRERVTDRRGRNIGSVAAARRQLELVFYALRETTCAPWNTCRRWHEHRLRLFPGRRGSCRS
jgi:Transposase IS116/IS110/IS902 family